MGQEPRRSGRATKGQHTKNFDLDQAPAPKRGKQSKKSKQAASEEPEEEDSIIRCVCGATEDEGGLKMICCEGCDAWQHNVCMAVTIDEDELDKLNYYCEQCRPEDHQELLQAMANGQKPWEERLRKHEEEEKAREAEQKAAKKGKKGSRRSGRQSTAAASEAVSSPNPAPSQKSPTPAATETSTKRKYEAVVDIANGRTPDPATAGAPKQATSVASETAPSATPEKPAKRTKSVSGQSRKSSVTSPVPRFDSIEKLPKERVAIAEALKKDFQNYTSEAIKKNAYSLPTGETVEDVSVTMALDVEHALHARYQEQKELASQFRSIKFNLKKNQSLFLQILHGSLPSEELVELTSEEMASEELQKERQRLKEQADKQAVLAHEEGPRYRKTHKGEELIGDDPHKTTDVYKAPVRRGTLEQQPSDVPVDTGSPPPTTEVPGDYDHQEHTEEPASASKPDFNIQEVWGKVKTDPAKAAGMLPRQPKRQSISSKVQDVVMRDAADDPDLATILKDNDTEMKPASSNIDDSTTLWRGRIEMNMIGEFSAIAKWAAGGDVGARIPYHQLLKSRIEIDGRIPIERANEYVAGLRYSQSTDVCCLAILPSGSDQERHGFEQVFNYFRERNRWAVYTAHGHEAVRDIYLVPIEAGDRDKLPSFVTMLERSTIDDVRAENMLLLTLVVRRPTPATPGGPPIGAIQPGLSHSGTPVNQLHPQFSPVPHGTPTFPPPENPFPPLATQVLGSFISAPVVSQMALNLPMMDEVQLQNLRDVLEREPSARGDIMSLSQYLAQRQMSGASQT